MSDESPKPEPDAAAPAQPERVAVPEGMESVLPEDAPRITLPLFEGPLDLLLYLIKRDKIDIHDIPIAPITHQYMEYLELMQSLNLDVAGEFMVMAATLIHIKSKMLVPIEPTEAEGDEEYVDPREELVQRLLEFQRYKEAAGILHQQAQIRAATWTRPDAVLPRFDDAGEEMLEAGLYDLIAAFKELLDRRKALLAHEVEAEGPPVEERMERAARDDPRGRVARVPGAVRLARHEGRDDRDVPRPAGARPPEARAGLPARDIRVDPGVPTDRAARRSAARSGGVAGERTDLAEKDDEKKKASALEAYVAGPPVNEPDDVGEVPGVEPFSEARALPLEGEEASVLPPQQIRAVLEALVFASPQPITPRDITRVLQGVAREDWERELAGLRADYARDERGLQLVEVAGGYQVTTRPEYNDWVRELTSPRTPTRLSIQALETLAVIAYKQPVTLPEIIALRGVKSGGVVKTLLEKRLIRITGRKEVVGRPMLYGTTKQFLLHFGLKDLGELPRIEEFAEVLGEEVDVAGLKRAIESPLPVETELSDPEGEQIPLFEGPPPESGDEPGGDGTPEAQSS